MRCWVLLAKGARGCIRSSFCTGTTAGKKIGSQQEICVVSLPSLSVPRILKVAPIPLVYSHCPMRHGCCLARTEAQTVSDSEPFQQRFAAKFFRSRRSEASSQKRGWGHMERQAPAAIPRCRWAGRERCKGGGPRGAEASGGSWRRRKRYQQSGCSARIAAAYLTA